MTTLLNKNVAVDPVVITIDDDDDTSEIIIESISRGSSVNGNNLAICGTVQEGRDNFFPIIDESSKKALPIPAKNKFSKKRCADSDISNEKEPKRLKLSNHVPAENSGKNEPSSTVKRCNRTLEQKMREWNLEIIEANNVFEKFIINCQIVCSKDKTLDKEMKEGLVISIAYNYPSLKMKNASKKVLADMKNIVSVSKYDSVIDETSLTYFRAVALSALQSALVLKAEQWQVKEMTDEIRDGFFQAGKPIFSSPCCSTKAVGRQKILAKVNPASSQVHSAFPTSLSKICAVNGRRIVSAAAGSATSLVQNDVELPDKTICSTPSKTSNNTSCLAKLLTTPALGSTKEFNPVSNSALNEENIIKICLVNGTRIVSAAAGSATSPVQKDVEIIDETLCSTPNKTSNNASCLAKLLTNPTLGSTKEFNPVSNSALNEENINKSCLVNGTRIVSAAAGSAPVQKDVEIIDETLCSTPNKTLNNTSCLAKLLVNPTLRSGKEFNPVPTSALNKENRSRWDREIKNVDFIPLICKSVINKTFVNNVQNEQSNLGFSERTRNSVLARTISNSNNNLLVKRAPREHQNMFLISQLERASDLVPVFNNNNFNGGPQFFTTMKPQSQAIVQISDNGNVNSLCTLANGNQNFPRSNNFTSANFSTNNSNNQFHGQFKKSLQNYNMVPCLNIPLPPTKLRPIAIDGSNVAFGHSKVNQKFSCKGIELCVKHFLQLGHTTVKAFVPHFRTRYSNQIVGREILSQGGMKQHVVLTPSRQVDGKMIVCYDDRFILDYAVESGAVVVSNDNFRDLLYESPQYNFVIKNRLLMYTFVEDLFLIPKDPLGRQGPDLKTFLRF